MTKKKYWSLWKKGFFYGLTMGIASFLILKGVSIPLSIEELQTLTNPNMTLIILLAIIIFMPIVSGSVMEFINKKVK